MMLALYFCSNIEPAACCEGLEELATLRIGELELYTRRKNYR